MNHNYKANYDKILEVLNRSIDKSSFINQKRKPKLTDIEIVALELTAQYMSIDSEHQRFRILRYINFENLNDRNVNSLKIQIS